MTIYHSDALTHLRTLPDSSVHAVITDPPYGLSKTTGEDVTRALTSWLLGDRERVPSGKRRTSRTVRDVLDAFVDRTLEAALASDHEIADRNRLLSECLAELRDVLSTGDQWVTRTLPADQIAAGDVIADKRGRLWAVTAVVPDVGWSTLTIRRGDREVDRATKHATTFPTLLTRTDERALALPERELGAEVVGRGVAP